LQPFETIQTPHPLVIHGPSLATQEYPDAPIPEPWSGMGELLDAHPARWESEEDGLAKALARLQRFVASSRFAFWYHLARHDLMRVVYLVRTAAAGREFSLWLKRHPLLSDTGGRPIEIPVAVVSTPAFPGTR